jgi:predicted DNA-binding transcriptional regulator AlpA
LAGLIINGELPEVMKLTVMPSDIPVVLDLPTAAKLLGIGRTAAYQSVREGTWPTPIIRIGRSIRVPRQPLLALLGLSTELASPLLGVVGAGDTEELSERDGEIPSAGTARASQRVP